MVSNHGNEDSTPIPPSLQPYTILIRAVLEGRLSGEDFSLVFVRLFKSDETSYPPEIFEPLDALFAAADLYSPDAQSRERFEVDESELKGVASSTLAKLEASTTLIPD